MPLIVLLLIIFLWVLWGRVSALKREYEQRLEDLEFTSQLLKDRIATLSKNIKASPEKVQQEKGATAAKKPDEKSAAISPKFSSGSSRSEPAVSKSDKSESSITAKQPDFAVAEPDVILAKSESDSGPSLDYSDLSFKDAAPEKTGSSESTKPEEKSYAWLKKEPEKAESAGGVRIEKVVSLDEPESSQTAVDGTEDFSGASFASGSGGDDEPPAGPDWQESWRNYFANVDWEQFTGTKLFAWLGGLALFIGAGFFVKYSIDNNLISPVMRLVIGAVIGLCMIAGSFWFERGRYDVMRQTFSAGGIGVLYSVFFAATLYYEYLAAPVGFVSLVVVSAAAFVLAIFHNGVSISVLGAVGAYLTPLLVQTGQGNILTLYLYLAIVNVGLYQVIRRLQSNWLLLFSSVGTMASLLLACVFTRPSPESLHIALAWAAHSALYAIFLDRLKPDYRQSIAASWTLNVTWAAMPIIAFFLAFFRTGSSPILLIAGATATAVILAYRQGQIHQRIMPFSAVSFMVVAFWAFTRFTPNIDSFAYLLFFIYGLVGGVGPILLIAKHGLSPEFLKWFRVFPVGIALLGLMVLIVNPNFSPVFWPMTIALQLIGIAISLVFGAIYQVGALALILLISALLFISGSATITFNLAFFAFIFAAGAAICIVTFVILRRIVVIAEKLNLQPETTEPLRRNPALTEWMAASPVMGIFFVLAAAFWRAVPLNPHPGMVTMLCFLAIALTLTRKLRFEYLAIVSLFSAAFSQAFWILRPGLSQGMNLAALGWSAGLFAASLALPFIFFKVFENWRRLWMSWAIYEVVQSLFLIYAADQIYARDISGWLPMALAVIKLPIVSFLLRHLAGRSERNSIIACHGGVLLFYLSAVPVLLLENGWLGLVLVLESAALLWLNRRIEHPGLRWVSVGMAPIGIFLMLSFMHQMKGPDSLILLNPAVLSTLLATLALAWSVRLTATDGPSEKFNVHAYFEWLAFGTGFYLVNLVVADVFAGSKVRSGPTLKFKPHADLLQQIAYTTCWALFGAMLWISRKLPLLLRVIGLVLVCISAFWLIMFPVGHGHAVAAMSPVFNLGLLAYLPIMLVLLFLFLKEPWSDDSYVTVKNLFLALLLVVGLLCIKMIKSTIFQPGMPFDLFRERTAHMAVASIAGWLIYGLAMLVWPKRLDKPFRFAGLVLMLIAIFRALVFPFKYASDFGAMQPLLNRPTILYLFIVALLIWLTQRKQDETWPTAKITSRVFWGITLAVSAFLIMNIEIASVFGVSGQPFSLAARNLSQQLGYSLGWLVYAIIMLAVGINRQVVRARQAALLLIIVTSLKIFLQDLWSLGQLYRVASFIGLAVIMMLVSYLYQRFLTRMGDDKNEN